jgi:branched-chain amino acid transport system permease protein
MQIIANGLVTGLAISVLAVAFSAVYLPTRVFHIALGGIYVVVPYIAWTCLKCGLSWPVAVGVAAAVAFLLSVACELINHATLDHRGASSGAHLVCSLGTYVVLVETVALVWGHETKVLRTKLSGSLTLGEVSLTHEQFLSALVCVALLACFFLWLRSSALGLRFRALADNPIQLALHGYNVRWLRLSAFGVSGLLCAGASLTVANDLGFDPNIGLSAVLLAVVAQIIGGRSSWFGPVLGGVLLGLIRSEVAWWLSASWQDPLAYLLLGIFLLGRPEGLLGRGGRLEATG